MNQPGTPDNPLRVAIVGSGPSGFYAAEALLKSGRTVTVDMIERLPVPFGLVRSGVAPDHPKLKMAALAFEMTAALPGFRFFGNVRVGKDVTIDELRRTHHAIVLACGAESDRQLGVPGEDLAGSHTATEFVGWYNGHPDYRDRRFDLSREVVAIIGQGNVAIDVTRILAKSVDELRQTDIAAHALEALAESRVREIHLIGRRGPAQAKFTNKELKELGELADANVHVAAQDLELNPESMEELATKSNFIPATNVEFFRTWAARAPAPGKRKTIHFHFLASPIRLEGAERVEKLVLGRNTLSGPAFEQNAEPTGEAYSLPAELLFRSIGYRGRALDGVPFEPKRGVFPNEAGRITGTSGLYATGWIKRGPSGIIGTNRACGVETVDTLLGDLPTLSKEARSGGDGLAALLDGRRIPVVDYAAWKRIDAEEIRRGQPQGKPREKFTRTGEMLDLLSSTS